MFVKHQSFCGGWSKTALCSDMIHISQSSRGSFRNSLNNIAFCISAQGDGSTVGTMMETSEMCPILWKVKSAEYEKRFIFFMENCLAKHHFICQSKSRKQTNDCSTVKDSIE